MEAYDWVGQDPTWVVAPGMMMKVYFMSVHLMVYYILCKRKYSFMQGYGTYKHHHLYQYVCDIWPQSLWHGIVNKKKRRVPDFVLHTKVPKPSNLQGVHFKKLTIFITTFTTTYQHTIIEPYKSSPQPKPHIYKIKNLYPCALCLN